MILDDQVMTIRQVADFLQFSDSKVYRLVKNGQLPGSKKIGGQWRVWRPALMAYLEGHGTGSSPPGAGGEVAPRHSLDPGEG